MDTFISKINTYLDFLNESCKLNVSIHFDGDILLRLPRNSLHRILKHNSHINSYCMSIKNENKDKCICNQRKIINSGKKEPYINICHAGVCELIYPVFTEENQIGFVAVSGYRRDFPILDYLAYDLWKESLCSEEIPFSLCNAVIPPLQIMLEKFFKDFAKEPVNEFNKIVQFLNEYHTSTTLSDLSLHFNKSNSYISHMFKKESGMSLREYCNNLRLEDAKKLLLETGSSVTEIALNIGFNDVSYFISLFRKKFGISPLKYRTEFISKN